MIKSLKNLIACLITVSLTACTGSYSISPSQNELDTAEQDQYLSTKWIKLHQKEVEDQIVAYIKSKHPTIPDSLPQLAIRHVTVKNQMRAGSRSNMTDVEHILKDIFQNVVESLLPQTSSETAWLDVDITFLRPTLSEGETAAAMAAAIPVCFGSLMLACPVKQSTYVVLDATVSRGANISKTIKGVGGATRVISTPLVDDNSDPRVNGTLDANSKALSAAIADLGAKLLPWLSSRNAP